MSEYEFKYSDLEYRVEHAKATDAETDSGLRRVLGYGTAVLMTMQIAIADGVFVVYGVANGWDLPAAAINVWLGAVVVQVVALALTIARYLFPGDGPRLNAAEN